MSQSRIPIELVRPIVEYLETTDLLVFARTNHVLQVEAEKVLYRHIGRETDLLKDVAAWCEALRSHPWRSDAVMSLVLGSIKSYDTTLMLENIPDIIATIQNLPSVTDLSLYREFPLDWLIGGRCRFTLRNFICMYPDGDILRFIESQPQIRHLELTTIPYSPSETSRRSSPATVPCLENLGSHPDVLAHFVPNHPVKTVSCKLGRVSARKLQDVLDILNLSTGPVVSFNIWLWDPIEEFKPFQTIAVALPSLEHLEVQFRDRTDWPYEDWCQTLSHLRKLRTFTYCALDLPEEPSSNRIVESLGHACPNIRTITFLPRFRPPEPRVWRRTNDIGWEVDISNQI